MYIYIGHGETDTLNINRTLYQLLNNKSFYPSYTSVKTIYFFLESKQRAPEEKISEM